MSFRDKLRHLMHELNLSTAELSRLTGINQSSISQYLAGRNTPDKGRRKVIAEALGVQADYFEVFLPEPEIQQGTGVNLPVSLAAQLMGKSKAWVEKGLQEGVFPWGYAVKLKRWSYFISPVKFTEYTGIPVPMN